MAEGWQKRLQKKFGRAGLGLFQGLILAGDGLAVEIIAPVSADLNGRARASFRNRKGYFALVVQAFCDSFCRFRYFDIDWPGSTNDITAYPMTMLYAKIMDGSFPSWLLLALDEAYGSLGGVHLAPFTKYQLDAAYRNGEPEHDLYYQMRAFNHVLSSLRIHIERAFGMLVRQWGIMWSPLAYRLKDATLIITACAMLHNVGVDRWLLEHGLDACGYDMRISGHEEIPNMLYPPTDAEIAARFDNRANDIEVQRVLRTQVPNTTQRTDQMALIREHGIIVAGPQSLEGLPGNRIGVDID
jgi:hypothetical protein